MKHELRKRHNLPNKEISDAERFTELCLGSVDYESMGEIPRYEITPGMYVVPQERPDGNQAGLARVCISRPVDVDEDEVADILDDSPLFANTPIWVLDGKDVDSERNERIFSILSMDWDDEEEDEEDLTFY